MTKLYHSTSAAGAAAIQRRGFRNSTQWASAGIVGVFLADRPLTGADGVAAAVDACFVVEVPIGTDLTEYEVIEDGRPGESYREWLVPAPIVNTWPRELLEGL